MREGLERIGLHCSSRCFGKAGNKMVAAHVPISGFSGAPRVHFSGTIESTYVAG
jgi:hypothetical protein